MEIRLGHLCVDVTRLPNGSHTARTPAPFALAAAVRFAAAGMLIQSSGPTYLYGVAAEHSAQYQYFLDGATDVRHPPPSLPALTRAASIGPVDCPGFSVDFDDAKHEPQGVLSRAPLARKCRLGPCSLDRILVDRGPR